MGGQLLLQPAKQPLDMLDDEKTTKMPTTKHSNRSWLPIISFVTL